MRGAEGGGDDGEPVEPPAEFPERWTKFLPPSDIRSRLRSRRRQD
jgi:membrane protein